MSYHKIIWSKGPFITEYAKLGTEKVVNEYVQVLITQSNGFLWIRNTSQSKPTKTDLDYVARYAALIRKPTILITTDGDRSVPRSYDTWTVNRILRHPNIIAWYTQNYDRSIIHPKLKYIPIGFDFHSKHLLVNSSRDQKLRYMCHCKETAKEKIWKIFSDSHLRITHPEGGEEQREWERERIAIPNLLKDNKDVVFLKEEQTFLEITQLYNKYLFAISPRGGGLDCHRTWELLLAGCIVITKTSALDEMYTKNNLPVVILKTWDELNVDLTDKMNLWYKEHFHKTSNENILPKLTFKYWAY